MKNKVFKGILFVLLLQGLSAAVWASSYKVEVIVFEQKQRGTEVFEQTTSTLQVPSSVIEVTAINDPMQISLLEEPLSGLNAVYAQITQQAHYNVLLKKAWVQVNNNQFSPAVHFQSGDRSLNGYISLMTAGAMSMQVDIEYMSAKENHYSQSMGASPIVYRLTQKRPLKFNESHYFDHPVIGVIMQVTPI
ncbi:MAG: CsiV family protein [Methylotenera sp.]